MRGKEIEGGESTDFGRSFLKTSKADLIDRPRNSVEDVSLEKQQLKQPDKENKREILK